ncbi:cytochrome c [Weeksellaceae bacterium TAE3-ERU29]|nr:cytochrome c [Weeksellaceae bacterium TAE3-ERU29]
MKRVIMLCAVMGLLITSCGKKDNTTTDEVNNTAPTVEEEVVVSDDPMQNKGIGPVKEVDLPEEIDPEMAAKGQEIYEAKCTACHKPTEKFIGPAPKDILQRRTPEWVMNMILNPVEMTQKDPIAQELLMEANGAPMANQNLTEEEARQVLEYFRTIN